MAEFSAKALLEAYGAPDTDSPTEHAEQQQIAQAEATVRHLETELSLMMMKINELRMQLDQAYVFWLRTRSEGCYARVSR